MTLVRDCLTSQQAVDFVNSRLEPHATGKRPTRTSPLVEYSDPNVYVFIAKFSVFGVAL